MVSVHIKCMWRYVNLNGSYDASILVSLHQPNEYAHLIPTNLTELNVQPSLLKVISINAQLFSKAPRALGVTPNGLWVVSFGTTAPLYCTDQPLLKPSLHLVGFFAALAGFFGAASAAEEVFLLRAFAFPSSSWPSSSSFASGFLRRPKIQIPLSNR